MMVVSANADAVGFGAMAVVTTAVSWQEPVVAITVYVPGVAGLMVAVVSPVLQTYVVPPVAVIVAGNPWHRLLLPVIVALGGGKTVMLTVAVLLHPPELPVTVYVVLVAGVTEMDELGDPVLQVYPVPPDALSVTASPPQMGASSRS